MLRDMDAGSSVSINGRRSTTKLAPAVFFVILGSGCDALLEVSNPGSIMARDLEDPALLTTLMRGVQGDFDCFFTNYIEVSSMWTGDIDNTTGTRVSDQVGLRDPAVLNDQGGQGCRGSSTSIAGLPLHTARMQAANTIRLIEAFPDNVVSNKSFLIARARLYEGFTYQIAGESYCEPTFDGGPVISRSDAMRVAEERFSSAIQLAIQAGGADAAEAANVVQAALIGRARARLNLNDAAGVLADASQVEEGFVFETWHSGAAPRLRNQVFERVGFARERAVSAQFRARSMLDGVPDPRVRWEARGPAERSAQTFYAQLKYTSFDDPMPIASWREAQLMIAEVSGGQTAVDIINRLRATHGLPQFSSTNAAEIAEQVREERRRELWLQTGARIGDMLRWDEPFRSGLDELGRLYGDLTCIPMHLQERIANPNIPNS
jgi:hypothetical protein